MKLLKITTLDKGWYDRDDILLHAAFQVLVDFVEREHPDRTIDWNADAVHKHVWKEIQSLYKWWKETRSSRRSPLDDEKVAVPPLKFKKILDSDSSQVVEPDRKMYGEYYRALKRHSQLEQKWYEEDQRNLHRLIEIRSHLWT